MRIALKLFFVPIASLILLSCFKDDDTGVIPSQVSARFTQRELTLKENDDPLEISIALARPAIREGMIFINVNAESLDDFTTSPAAESGQIKLPVSAGQASVKFTLTPVDNELVAENKSIEFTIAAVSEGFMVGTEKVLSITLTDDEDNDELESLAQVNFLLSQSWVRENSTSGSAVMIAFTQAVPGASAMEISLSSSDALYGTHFITIPAAVNGKIDLNIEAGADHVSFQVIPMNDLLYNDARAIIYTISQVQGSITKGDAATHQLSITDDELEGKNKGYTIIAGSWSYKKKYEYNADGSLSKTLWEQHTPGYSAGTYQYHYNSQGQVIKRVDSPVTEIVYTWQDGRINKAEKFTNGVLKQYTVYGYDDAGNIGESAIHDLQPNGEFELSLLLVYLYQIDGNIYKQLTYSPVGDSEDYTLLSTRTYENYLNKQNSFSMVEILPNVNSQPNLPGFFRVEKGGHNILYQFTYEFDAAGKPTKRTATSSAGSEVAYYEYY